MRLTPDDLVVAIDQALFREQSAAFFAPGPSGEHHHIFDGELNLAFVAEALSERLADQIVGRARHRSPAPAAAARDRARAGGRCRVCGCAEELAQ